MVARDKELCQIMLVSFQLHGGFDHLVKMGLTLHLSLMMGRSLLMAILSVMFMLVFALRYGSVWSYKSLNIDFSLYNESPFQFSIGKDYVGQTAKVIIVKT